MFGVPRLQFSALANGSAASTSIHHLFMVCTAISGMNKLAATTTWPAVVPYSIGDHLNSAQMQAVLHNATEWYQDCPVTGQPLNICWLAFVPSVLFCLVEIYLDNPSHCTVKSTVKSPKRAMFSPLPASRTSASIRSGSSLQVISKAGFSFVLEGAAP
eukprot:TRINITY_DN67079_c14_g1_i2.p2 TRINITY_DN67079_c14_g1~~TRINITY_DN67079_c14_g1_i2.p2  ORF type:complete len:158 (-),score=4.35 TRINITY_DN67079_c14_g1_i2:686-1159(-)